jgi:hypothetical protein
MTEYTSAATVMTLSKLRTQTGAVRPAKEGRVQSFLRRDPDAVDAQVEEQACLQLTEAQNSAA